MSKWNYFQYKNNRIRLKSKLICIFGVLACIIGTVTAGDIVQTFIFPKGPYIERFDGNVFTLEVELKFSNYIESWIYISRVNLKTETPQNGTFPDNVNATRIWIIPLEGRFLPWRDYLLRTLKFDTSPSSPCSESCSPYIIEDFDGIQNVNFKIIVEINASGRIFYLDKWKTYPYYLEIM